MALHAVRGLGLRARALGEHHVLQSAGQHRHAFLLGVLGQVALAFLAHGLAGLGLLALEKFADGTLGLGVVEERGVAFEHVGYSLRKLRGVEVFHTHALEVVADDHAQGVTEFFHNVGFVLII